MKKLSIILTIAFYFLSWSIVFAQKETKTITQSNPDQSTLEWDIPIESKLIEMEEGKGEGSPKDYIETHFPGIPFTITTPCYINDKHHNTIYPKYISLEEDRLLVLGAPMSTWNRIDESYDEKALARFKNSGPYGHKLKEKGIKQIGPYSFIWLEATNEEESEFSYIMLESSVKHPKQRFKGVLFFRTDERKEALKQLKEILKSTRMK